MGASGLRLLVTWVDCILSSLKFNSVKEMIPLPDIYSDMSTVYWENFEEKRFAVFTEKSTKILLHEIFSFPGINFHFSFNFVP